MKKIRSKKLLDAEDVAKFWGIHTETVRLKARKGILKPVCEHPFLFRREDIMNLPVPKWGRPRKNQTAKEVRI